MGIVTVVYHGEPEGWWAESPDVRGFVAAGQSLAEVRGLAREGLPFYVDDPELDMREQMGDGSLLVEAQLDPAAPLTVQGETSTGVTVAIVRNFVAEIHPLPEPWTAPVGGVGTGFEPEGQLTA